MTDQVNALTARGITASYVNATISRQQASQRLRAATEGRLTLLYVTPERLTTPPFLEIMSNCDVRLLAVDEAHCVSEWGHDFRPEYRQIGRARISLGNPPCLAVTATAVPRVRRHIRRYLHLRKPGVFTGGFDRPNIHFSVVVTEHKILQLERVIGTDSGSTIVYAATRRRTEDLAERLTRAGHSAAHYHGGMDAVGRHKAQSDWVAERVRIMVATNAFGMGIDKSNVRSVVHFDMSMSLEAYYQEAGRAGRDGMPAHAILLHTPGDENIHWRIVSGDDKGKKGMRSRLAAASRLRSMIAYVRSSECRRRVILRHFGDVLRHACSGCDTCDLEREPPVSRRAGALKEVLRAVENRALGAGSVNDRDLRDIRYLARSGWIVVSDTFDGRLELGPRARRRLAQESEKGSSSNQEQHRQHGRVERLWENGPREKSHQDRS
jgi:ATP-dependent DNA helicase RecQ